MRIVIAEDDSLLREGLALLLKAEGLDVVATVANAEDFLAAVDEHVPDVAIVDVRMPPTHTDEGIVAAVEARRRQPGLAVLVLSAYVEQAFATDLFTTGGARLGYLLKERVGDIEAFTDAVGRVAAGGSALDPEVVGRMLGRRRRRGPLDELTPREREVLAHLAQGKSNTGIAQALVVTNAAVEKHVTTIFQKLGLDVSPTEHRRVRAALTYLRDSNG